MNNNILIKNKSFFKGVKATKGKLKYVLSKISSNLIFSIENHEKRVATDVRYFHDEGCPCISCCFFRLEFGKVFKQFSKRPVNIDNRFKWAFINYQCGNFLKEIFVVKIIWMTSRYG